VKSKAIRRRIENSLEATVNERLVWSPKISCKGCWPPRLLEVNEVYTVELTPGDSGEEEEGEEEEDEEEDE